MRRRARLPTECSRWRLAPMDAAFRLKLPVATSRTEPRLGFVKRKPPHRPMQGAFGLKRAFEQNNFGDPEQFGTKSPMGTHNLPDRLDPLARAKSSQRKMGLKGVPGGVATLSHGHLFEFPLKPGELAPSNVYAHPEHARPSPMRKYSQISKSEIEGAESSGNPIDLLCDRLHPFPRSGSEETQSQMHRPRRNPGGSARRELKAFFQVFGKPGDHIANSLRQRHSYEEAHGARLRCRVPRWALSYFVQRIVHGESSRPPGVRIRLFLEAWPGRPPLTQGDAGDPPRPRR